MKNSNLEHAEQEDQNLNTNIVDIEVSPITSQYPAAHVEYSQDFICHT